MKSLKLNLFFFVSAAILTVASCDKPDMIDPDDDKNQDVEVPDTTARPDTNKQEPVVPAGTFSISTAFSGGNSLDEGIKLSWVQDDALNVFSVEGTTADEDASKWINHGKFVYDPTSENAFVGDLDMKVFDNKSYTWHAVYPYNEAFTIPIGLDDSNPEGQKLTIGHKPGEYLVQQGYDNADHLAGPHCPLYGAAHSKGKEVPEFRMHQMVAVFKVHALNRTSAPIKITEVKLTSADYYDIVGDFAVDFSKVTTFGHGNINLKRSPIAAATEAVLKVEGAEELPVGESAEFYFPIMPNKFAKNDRFVVTIGDYTETAVLASDIPMSSGKMHEFNVTIIDPIPVELTSPADNSTIDLTDCERVEFSWKPVEGYEEYGVLFSASEDMSDFVRVDVKNTKASLSAEMLDYQLFRLGLESGKLSTVYWSAVVKGDERPTEVNSLNVKRLVVDSEDRIADPLTVKVAVVYEDFIVPGTDGKRMHEVCALHAPGGYRLPSGGWYDPEILVKEYKEGLETASHGVVNYEIVEERYADRFFTYFNNSVGHNGSRDYITLDTLLYLFETRQVDNNTSYDYVEMLKYYGYDKMVDAGELHEVWVYSFPAGGMAESQMIGSGAFWCNSTGIGKHQGAPCTNKCIVMGLNYERTADLALHSCCHRVESIMNQVYGDGGWNYSTKGVINSLTNWEKFSAHNNEYEKYEAGHAHIGMCHWPPNSAFDYDYGNSRYVYTYADTWYDYPYIKEENARRVNRSEWKHPGGDQYGYQYGYMLWYYDHIPHFKGLCPRDGHLNNWWHYIVLYDDAMAYEKQLKNENPLVK